MLREPLPDSANAVPDDDDVDLVAMAQHLLHHWKLLISLSIVVALSAFGVASLLQPVFTARTSLLPPQQQQSAAASALAALGALGGLPGAGGVKSPAEQYVALMQSRTVADRMIDKFQLLQTYDVPLRHDARRSLEQNSRFAVGKRDGLITIEVDDTSPQRAADMANTYVEELRRMTSVLAVSEAQQRRAFFEQQMRSARDQLTQAQQALQASGFTQGALRAEPRSTAEAYARLKAQLTAGEVRLQTLRGTLADDAVEMQQQRATLAALRGQLAQLEQAASPAGSGPDYIGKYREFKYQETLFELLARQYEMARVDEAREGALIQVVDAAAPPERKSRPKRAVIAFIAGAVAFLMLCVVLLLRRAWREAQARRTA